MKFLINGHNLFNLFYQTTLFILPPTKIYNHPVDTVFFISTMVELYRLLHSKRFFRCNTIILLWIDQSFTEKPIATWSSWFWQRNTPVLFKDCTKNKETFLFWKCLNPIFLRMFKERSRLVDILVSSWRACSFRV